MVTVSVDTLATIVALITTLAGQTWILERRLGGRVDRLEDRMDAMDAKFERKFDQVDRRFEQVDRRFEQVDRRFDQMHQQMFALAAGLKPLVEQAQRADAG